MHNAISPPCLTLGYVIGNDEPGIGKMPLQLCSSHIPGFGVFDFFLTVLGFNVAQVVEMGSQLLFGGREF